MRKFLIFLILITLLSFLVYNYIYQDHRNIQTEQADFKLTSNALSIEFLNNSTKSEALYLNKTIQISGNISEINNNDLTLDNVVFCSFNTLIVNQLPINSKINIKGRVIGFDDLLEQVKLDQCTIN